MNKEEFLNLEIGKTFISGYKVEDIAEWEDDNE